MAFCDYYTITFRCIVGRKQNKLYTAGQKKKNPQHKTNIKMEKYNNFGHS